MEHGRLVKELTLRSSPDAKRYFLYGRDSFVFAHLGISDSEIAVSIGPHRTNGRQTASRLWSHTIFELENFSTGLRFVSLGSLPQFYEVPSRDLLIGPSVGLTPALSFELGHPGIGVKGVVTTFHCSIKYVRRAGRSFVLLDAINDHCAERAAFEIDDILRFSEELYEQAKLLGTRFIRDADQDAVEEEGG